jgi:quinol monooxygenase YgiN
MITIVARSIIKEDKVKEFKKLAEELVRESQKEDGCISYDLYEDIKEANAFTFIEEWKDMDAIEKHNNADHFTTIVPQFVELREDSIVNLYKRV